MNLRVRPWWLPVLVLLGVALHAPSLGLGFYADDYLLKLVLEGRAAVQHVQPWNLYDFGRLEDWADLPGSTGTLPWWSGDDWQVRFLRPLTSLSLWLDHALFGDFAPGWHAHSLALYALLLVLAHRLYRALGLGPGVALLALAFFAATNGASLPVGWVANRNTLLASLFTVAAVLALRSGERRRDIALALALSACAVACKESGVIAFALVAVRLLPAASASTAPRARRIARTGVALALVLAALYVALLVGGGYGTRSLFYATPWREPLRYLGHLGVLFTAGLFRLVAPASLDLLTVKPTLLAPFVGASTLLVGGLVLIMWRRLRATPTAGFFLVWIVLGLLPQGATLPSDRLLLDAAIGSAGLLALYVASALALAQTTPASARERFAARTLLMSAGLLSALSALVQTSAIAAMSREVRAQVLATEVGPRALGRRDVVVLQAGTALVPFTLPATWSCESDDLELAFSILQMGRRGLEWVREDERTMVLTSLDEPFLTNVFESVYRTDPSHPPPGARFATPLLEVEVLRSEGSGVRSFRVRFERDLDDPTLRFVLDEGGFLVHVRPPAVGATLLIPAALPSSPLAL